MEQVYQYLIGIKFRQRVVEAVIEKFSDMREDLDRERKFMGRHILRDRVDGRHGWRPAGYSRQGHARNSKPRLPLLESSTLPERKAS